MRLTESLTLPADLERARNVGELVVFAGAGVSMGPPANLPSFVALAREIGEPTLELRAEDKQALDQYLTRAERLGVKVQERARSKLIERGGDHTPLHRHLVGLFGAAGGLRLITTNFDTHFTSAARGVFGQAHVPLYVGPALPPGREFRGIAQLHGSLDNPQDRLVLTKSDFAAAYMTDGWAARFLVGVFSERAVLFVGYSLTDPVMRYLVSALPPTNRWYALCTQEESANWVDHGVTPVTFATREGPDRYGELNAGIERWFWYASSSTVDHDTELRKLVALGPPASPRDTDYIRARLTTQPGRIGFWTTATDLRWFRWAADEKLLDVLFDDQAYDAEGAAWARWCVKNFCTGESPPLLGLIRRRSFRLSPALTFELARDLAAAEALPPGPVVRQLVALLVSQKVRPPAGLDPHAWLLEKLVKQGFADEALAILNWMTQVRLEPLDRIYLAIENEDPESPSLADLTSRVALHAPPDDIMRFLGKAGQELANVAADGLVRLGEQRIAESYALLALARSDEGFDPLSYGRTSIAPSNQDLYPNAEDALIEIVRAGLDAWRDSSPESLIAFADRNSRDKRRLLQRLAIYAFAEAGSMEADELLARAVRERWYQNVWIRPELYRALRAHYATASESSKRAFAEALRDDASWGAFDVHQAHARFSLSQLLLTLCPASPATQEFAKEQTELHPVWKQQDPDGFLSRVEVGWGSHLPPSIPVEQMLRWSATEAYEHIVAELAHHEEPEYDHPVLGAVQQAVREASDWGARLLAVVASRDEAPSALAESLMWAVRDADASIETRLVVLGHANAWQWPDRVTHPLSMVLARWARDIDVPEPIELLDGLDSAADRVFDRSRAAMSAVSAENGLTERAINHPAGNAAVAWWAVASARNKKSGQFVLAIGDLERARWERALEDDSAAGANARVILGQASERLVNGDYPWAEKMLLPAFDPHSGVERAAQLWDGRLTQQSWSWTTVQGLRPYLTAFLQVSSTLVPGRSRELGGWIAMLVAHPAESGLLRDDLTRFAQFASPEARQAFADGLPEHLKRLTPVARSELWRTMLAPYWRDRRTNVPAPFDPAEVAHMIGWVVALPEVAGEAMAELCQTQSESVPHSDRVLWEWRQDDSWIRGHPEESTRLIQWLADRGSVESWNADDAVMQLEVALASGAAKAAVIAAGEALAAIPCDSGAELVRRLRGA